MKVMKNRAKSWSLQTTPPLETTSSSMLKKFLQETSPSCLHFPPHPSPQTKHQGTCILHSSHGHERSTSGCTSCTHDNLSDTVPQSSFSCLQSRQEKSTVLLEHTSVQPCSVTRQEVKNQHAKQTECMYWRQSEKAWSEGTMVDIIKVSAKFSVRRVKPKF